MRPITPFQITVFSALFAIILVVGITSGWLLVGSLALGDFRGVAVLAAVIVCTYLSAFAVYRLFLRFFPLGEGEIIADSREEFSAQVNILFYLLLFNSLIRTHFLPVPVLRLVYLALGARLGRNTYSAGVLLDPPLTIAGDNCIIGHDAVLFAHAIEGVRFSLETVRLGNDVTIGAHAVLMAGVSVGDGAIVSAGAVVLKGTYIGPKEVWGGVPARRLKASASVPQG
jgi:acetyltransferase-like isoleucine patch superfamily enzyme